MEQEEQWRTVVYNGEVFPNYEVSTRGRIRSLNYRRTGEIKVLKQNESSIGYLHVVLSKNGKRKDFLVHRTVAYTFPDLVSNDNPTEKTEIDHIDRNKHNNHVSNLRWITRQGNINNTDQSEKSKRVRCIETGIIFESTKDVERQTGLPQQNIGKCCLGKRKTCGKLHWEYVD